MNIVKVVFGSVGDMPYGKFVLDDANSSTAVDFQSKAYGLIVLILILLKEYPFSIEESVARALSEEILESTIPYKMVSSERIRFERVVRGSRLIMFA